MGFARDQPTAASGGTLHSDSGATIKTVAGSTNVLSNVFVTNAGTFDVTADSKLIYKAIGIATAAPTASTSIVVS